MLILVLMLAFVQGRTSMDLCLRKGEEGSLDVWIQYQAKMKLALIPNMMYLPRVQAIPQMKSESL